MQIYNPAFVTFIQEMSHSYDLMDFSNVELDGALDFIDASLDLYSDEASRRTRIDGLRVLGLLRSQEITIDARAIAPNGVVTIPCPTSKQDAYVRIVEMKNEIGEGGSDPIVQAECGFVLICSSEKVAFSFLIALVSLNSLPQYKPFRDASCCPMFLVGVAGPHLTVSGAIFAEKIVSQRFTDYIYLGPLPTSQERFPLDHSIRRVAQVLRALTKATNQLSAYYSTLKFTSTSTPKQRGSMYRGSSHRGSSHPVLVPSFPILPDLVPPSFRDFEVYDKRYTVVYKRRLDPSFPDKAVFLGTISNGDKDQGSHDVVIKFTPAYCKDAHEMLARIQRAPTLWFCERVETVGMYVVVMGYEEAKPMDKLLKDEHIIQLKEAVEALHGAGYVHGDLRGPNVLITKDGLRIIDLDWCGKVGVARYPAHIYLSSGHGWHSEVCRGGLITKEHDEHMFGVLAGLPYQHAT